MVAAQTLDVPWRNEAACKGHVATLESVHLLRPKCLMNANGKSVVRAVQALGISDPSQVYNKGKRRKEEGGVGEEQEIRKQE